MSTQAVQQRNTLPPTRLPPTVDAYHSDRPSLPARASHVGLGQLLRWRQAEALWRSQTAIRARPTRYIVSPETLVVHWAVFAKHIREVGDVPGDDSIPCGFVFPSGPQVDVVQEDERGSAAIWSSGLSLSLDRPAS